MQKIPNENRNQLLEILRFIIFIPASFLIGRIFEIPLFFVGKFQESMLGIKNDSWGSHLWQTCVIYFVIFVASKDIKPKFLQSKYFILIWSIVLTFNSIIFMSVVTMPYNPEFPRINAIIDAFIPIVIFIYLIKDQTNDILKLSKSNK